MVPKTWCVFLRSKGCNERFHCHLWLKRHVVKSFNFSPRQVKKFSKSSSFPFIFKVGTFCWNFEPSFTQVGIRLENFHRSILVGSEVCQNLKLGFWKFYSQTVPADSFKCSFFSPLPGEMIQFDEHIFSIGLKPPPRVLFLEFFSKCFGLSIARPLKHTRMFLGKLLEFQYRWYSVSATPQPAVALTMWFRNDIRLTCVCDCDRLKTAVLKMIFS